MGQLQRGLFVIRFGGQRLDVLQYSSLDPFSGMVLVLSCFLNRKFLTWEWLLGLGRWRTLWWIPQGTLVAACPALHHSFPAPTSSSRPSPETVVLSGALGVGFTDFFFFLLMLCLLFFLF